MKTKDYIVESNDMQQRHLYKFEYTYNFKNINTETWIYILYNYELYILKKKLVFF